jgi:Peptidase C39 family
MNYINTNIFISFFLGIIFCFAGRYIRIQNDSNELIWTLFCGMMALPALSFALYYLHIVEPPTTYIQFRTIPYIEILSSLIGITIGYFLDKGLIINLLLTTIVISVPFLKPIVSPIKQSLPNRWADKICLQSGSSTCGAASLATIYQFYDIPKTEQEIAHESHSCASGTEIWYLIRYAEKHNLNVKYLKINHLNDVKIPSILGTTLTNGVGHFITLLGKEGDNYIIGEPLKGKLRLSEAEFKKNYELHSIAFQFNKK